MSEIFLNFLNSAGIVTNAIIPADGQLHRFHVEGDSPKSSNGWAVRYDNPPSGAFGCWKRGISEIWSGASDQSLSDEERARCLKNMRDARKLQEVERELKHAECRKKAKQIWGVSKSCQSQHPYLRRKGVSNYGLKISHSDLVVPVRNVDGELYGLQFIKESGDKKFLSGTSKKGCYFSIGKPNGILCITEGYATGASIHEATGFAVAVAFDAGNLMPVAGGLRTKFPDIKIIVCADDDYDSETNPGATKGKQAALSINAHFVVPSFLKRDANTTDFNDLAMVEGHDIVKQQIDAAMQPLAEDKEQAVTCIDVWDEPLLFDGIRPPQIPTSLLPAWLGEYAEAVSQYTQTPPGLSVMLALSVGATCLQKRFVVAPRGNDYQEPLNLWTVTALPPASRKTAVISLFTDVLGKWEQKEAELLSSVIRNVNLQRKADKKRIEWLITKMAKENSAVSRKKLFEQADEIEQNMVGEIHSPLLWTGDVTPERLQMLLVEHGEKISLLTDEGGIFEVMGGLYNNGKVNIDVFLQAHSGSTVRVERQQRCAHLSSPALSIGLAVQPDIIASLSQGSKKKFRGNGALARFLYCLPENNIGKRNVRLHSTISDYIKVSYEAGINKLLDIPCLKNSTGNVIPRRLSLDPYALDSWEAFAIYIEERQGPRSEFEIIQDWTGKLPGAALRIAAIFHVVEYGETVKKINESTMDRAIELAYLLIEHAHAAFGIIGSDKGTADAKAILNWIIDKSIQEFTRRDCHRALKATFNNISEVKTALEILSDRAIVSELVEAKTGGRSSWGYKVNPQIHEQPIS